MSKLCRNLVRRAHELLSDPLFQQRNKRNAADFTRARKLGFVVIMTFLLNFVRKSLQIEVDEFYDAQNTPAIQRATMDAFIKARDKISPSAFIELFQSGAELCMNSDELPTFNRYRIFAVDGSQLLVPATPDILNHLHPSTNDPKRAAARVSVLCEVQTGIIIDAAIGPLTVDERSMAMQHLERFFPHKKERDVVLFDRGYPSKALFAHFVDNNAFFVMRIQRSFNRQIDDAPYGETSVTFSHNGSSFSLRVCKYRLSCGVDETLVTNLPRADFSLDDLFELYSMRWGVETQYDTLKNKLQLERFACRKWDFILQDFFATMFLSNIVAAAAIKANERIDERERGKTYKHPHSVSKNVLIGKLKNHLFRALAANTSSARSRYLNKIYRDASRCYDCVRPNRSVPRRSRQETHHKTSFPRKRSI